MRNAQCVMKEARLTTGLHFQKVTLRRISPRVRHARLVEMTLSSLRSINVGVCD